MDPMGPIPKLIYNPIFEAKTTWHQPIKPAKMLVFVSPIWIINPDPKNTPSTNRFGPIKTKRQETGSSK